MFGLTFDSTLTGTPHPHDLALVAMSFLVALLASYSALDMAERLRSSEGRGRTFWLCMSGIMLGGGIWAMHFIAMIAYDGPMEHSYDPAITLLSGLIAVVAVTLGLSALGRRPTLVRFLVSGAGVGAAIATMHYVGMSAMIMPEDAVTHHPGYFIAAVVIAVAAATAALWLSTTVTHALHRAAASLAMAVAICGMHYTAMAGMTAGDGMMMTHADQVSDELLAAIVMLGVGALIALGLVMAFLDRRAANRAVAEAERLRELNAELEQARAAAEAASEAKTRFLATMSHEIRTPMNGVLGMLEAAMREKIDPGVRDQIATAKESAVNLLQILNDILDLSKIESGQMPIEKISFSMRQEIDTALSIFEPVAKQNGLRLDRNIDPGLPQWVVGDPTRFRQIVTNLVGNAFKFTAEGGVTVSAHYSTDEGRKGTVRITVADTGIGMDEKARAKLFARFSQADASTTRRYGGTGLGLAICRELVTAMAGCIGVESKPGQGSTFWFELPAEDGVEPAWLKAQKKADVAPSRPLQILVAEDHPVNQKVLRALLGPTGHQMHFVSDGVQAISAVEAGAFDVVLMDIHMPVMDGVSATRQIRSLPGDIASIPIIALTANAMAGDREHYIEAGMSDYVSKPVQLHDLLEAIARQCGGSVVERTKPVVEQSAEAPAVSAEASLDDLLASFDTAPEVRAA